MTPWTLPPWQVDLMRTLGALPDRAQVVAALPRQYGTRLRTTVVKAVRRG